MTGQIARVIKTARLQLGISQKEAAARAGVSHRLWAEVERDERPNVSLQTVLRMLAEIGATVHVVNALGETREVEDPSSLATARAARAELRRSTWGGQQRRLEHEGRDELVPSSPTDRLKSVMLVSQQAFTIAAGKQSAKARVARRRRARVE